MFEKAMDKRKDYQEKVRLLNKYKGIHFTVLMDDIKEKLEVIYAREHNTSSRLNFIKSLCSLSLHGGVWELLWENGPRDSPT